MSDKQSAGIPAADDATVVMSKSAVPEHAPVAATVINSAVSGVNIPINNTGSARIGVSQHTQGAVAPAAEKPRSIALAIVAGALTGLMLLALTVWWLSRG